MRGLYFVQPLKLEANAGACFFVLDPVFCHPSSQRSLADSQVRSAFAHCHQHVTALRHPLAADLACAQSRNVVQQARYSLKQLLDAFASRFSLLSPSLCALVRNLVHGCCSDRSASTVVSNRSAMVTNL
jgi:hypothetical protein